MNYPLSCRFFEGESAALSAEAKRVIKKTTAVGPTERSRVDRPAVDLYANDGRVMVPEVRNGRIVGWRPF